MDDPIFDPWSAAEPTAEESAAGPPEPEVTAPVNAERSTRWRSGTHGVPAPRSVPRPIPAPAADPAPIPAKADKSSESTESLESSRARVEVSPSLPPGPTSPRIQFLRECARPRLEALAHQLQVARHETVLDDRLHEPSASLRFRLTPRRGPFDEPRSADGSVLEIRFDADADEFRGRLWLDPLSETPTRELTVEASRISEVWIDRLVLAFVENALRQS